MKGIDIAARACALVGTRFRPQGRSPSDGLDCVGVVALAAGIEPDGIPRDYSLRGQKLAQIEQQLFELGCRPVAGRTVEPGDVAVCRTGPAQYHLVVVTSSGVVHADAALRRVVQRPHPIPWTVESSWRLAEEE